jgi:hypothetical protein
VRLVGLSVSVTMITVPVLLYFIFPEMLRFSNSPTPHRSKQVEHVCAPNILLDHTAMKSAELPPEGVRGTMCIIAGGAGGGCYDA